MQARLSIQHDPQCVELIPAGGIPAGPTVLAELARSIPVYRAGELVATLDWIGCPGCGRLVALGGSCPDCQLELVYVGEERI